MTHRVAQADENAQRMETSRVPRDRLAVDAVHVLVSLYLADDEILGIRHLVPTEPDGLRGGPSATESRVQKTPHVPHVNASATAL